MNKEYKFLCISAFCGLLFFCFIIFDKKTRKSERVRWCAYNNSIIMEINDNESFYIHLLSNVSSPASHRTNTVANFVTKLAEKIKVSDEWEVGLSEISYTKSWYNIPTEHPIKIFTSNFGTQHGGGEECNLRAGYYNSVEQLVSEINKQFKCLERGSQKALMKRSPELRYDVITNRIYVQPGANNHFVDCIFPYLPRDVEQLLGLSFSENETYFDFFRDKTNDTMLPLEDVKLKKIIDYTKVTENTDRDYFVMELESPYAVQFNVCDMHLLVYCSIIQPVLVGDTYTKLLRQVEIPRDVKYGDQVVLRYLEPFYYPLISQEIESIEIDINNDSGERVPFDFGRSTLTLHFRKKYQNDSQSSFSRLLR